MYVGRDYPLHILPCRMHVAAHTAGKYDAFETTLEVLRVKGRHPAAHPKDYAGLDRDFRLFMNCGAEELGGGRVDGCVLISGKSDLWKHACGGVHAGS